MVCWAQITTNQRPQIRSLRFGFSWKIVLFSSLFSRPKKSEKLLPRPPKNNKNPFRTSFKTNFMKSRFLQYLPCEHNDLKVPNVEQTSQKSINDLETKLTFFFYEFWMLFFPYSFLRFYLQKTCQNTPNISPNISQTPSKNTPNIPSKYVWKHKKRKTRITRFFSEVVFPHFWPLGSGIADFWPEHRIRRQKLYILPAGNV